ncbi:eukaryotic aspartyl protease [Colletotrichum incanum]|nr:eukaryotic aspartyl protease [Colletotrichum incanum]
MGLGRTGKLPSPLISILGVGPSGSETSVLAKNAKPYTNFPENLKAQGLTRSITYSVYLNDFRAPTGSVVFGGVDTAKFTGQMQMVPLIDNTAQPAALGGKNLPPVLIDTGNPSLSFPPQLLDQIGPAIKIQTLKDGTKALRCDNGNTGAKFSFEFQAAKAELPLSMIFIPLTDNGALTTDRNGNPLCTLPLESINGNIASLGAPLLSAVYTVFDLENKQLGMAQAKVNESATNIQEIGPDGRIPTTQAVRPKGQSMRFRNI